MVLLPERGRVEPSQSRCSLLRPSHAARRPVPCGRIRSTPRRRTCLVLAGMRVRMKRTTSMRTTAIGGKCTVHKMSKTANAAAIRCLT